jgi:hypothetical protein
MSLFYHCPKCRATLNPNIRVVLVARFEERKGIVLLSPKLGDYDFHCDKGFREAWDKGDMLEFLCPVCTESLTSPTVDHFAELVQTDSERPDREFLLRFSRVCEERATFLFDGETVKEFGEDAENLHRHLKIDGRWGW